MSRAGILSNRTRRRGPWPVREIVLALWLNGFFAVMIATGGRGIELLFFNLLAGAGLVAWLVRREPARFRVGVMTSWGTLLLFGSVVVSYALNIDRFPAYFIVANMVSMLLAVGTAYLLATRAELDYRALLAFHAGFAMLLLPIPLATGQMVWGRLTGELHPNFIGMIAMVAFVGALGIRNWPLKIAVIGGTAAVMVAGSSRASIVGAALAAACYAACQAAGPVPLAERDRRTRRVALVLLASVLVVTVLWAAHITVIVSLLDSLLKVNDPYRGLSSGASGRTELWAAALELWKENPFFGVGFKGHPPLMPNHMSAHSGYLAMLAETGIVGLAGYLVICGAALVGALRWRRDPARQTALALLVSYLFYGLIEYRSVGFGNPYSILFLWIAFDGMRLPISPMGAGKTAAPSAIHAPADIRQSLWTAKGNKVLQ
ncbi:MAG: O-antigen ligase family protein [Ramlibacter sp.]